VLEVQLRALAKGGITHATVMVGFGAEQVEGEIQRWGIPGIQIETFYNPFYKLSDNLMTVWLAQHLMTDDFVLLNGDTLFEVAVLEKLLASPRAPLTIAINEKSGYDEDDMKVARNGGSRLRAVGKTLSSDIVDGESIGLMLFRGSGVKSFRDQLNSVVREEKALKLWYLSIVNALTETMIVETCSISGLWWGEVDYPEDLTTARNYFDERDRKRPVRAHSRPSA
jgi:choline kinase